MSTPSWKLLKKKNVYRFKVIFDQTGKILNQNF